MKKIFNISLIVLLIGSMGGIGYFFYQKNKEPEVVHETFTPEYREIVKKTVATGSIVPRKEIELKSQVSGVVDKIFVEPGEIVTSGQLVARIRIIPDVVALNNAEARLKTAQINLENAKREYKRQKQLFEQKVIPENQFNQFKLDYELRKQEVDAAESNLELIKEGAAKKSSTSSNKVYSTVEGMLLDVPVEEGDFVIESNTFNEGTTISIVANMNEMIFEGMVDESEVGKIREGMPLVLTVGALGAETFDAKLEYISPKGIEEEGGAGAIQFEIRADVKRKENRFLRAGYSANADIVLERKDSVLSVKERDLVISGDSSYVEIAIGEQEFEKRTVETGLSDGVYVEVLSGLSTEDKVKKQGS